MWLLPCHTQLAGEESSCKTASSFFRLEDWGTIPLTHLTKLLHFCCVKNFPEISHSHSWSRLTVKSLLQKSRTSFSLFVLGINLYLFLQKMFWNSVAVHNASNCFFPNYWLELTQSSLSLPKSKGLILNLHSQKFPWYLDSHNNHSREFRTKFSLFALFIFVFLEQCFLWAQCKQMLFSKLSNGLETIAFSHK